MRDDSRRNISATLDTAPDDTPAKADAEQRQSKGPILGVSIRDLNAAELKQLDTKGGVLIQDVRRGGIASQARILPGDVVTQINNKAIGNTKDFIGCSLGFEKKYRCASDNYP